jgi:hypothetical protein
MGIRVIPIKDSLIPNKASGGCFATSAIDVPSCHMQVLTAKSRNGTLFLDILFFINTNIPIDIDNSAVKRLGIEYRFICF